MRFQGTALVKRFKGDREAAQQYLPVARTLLGRMLAYLGPGVSGSRRWVLPNGVVIRTLMAGDVPMVEIDVTPLSPIEILGDLKYPLVKGILFHPSSDLHPQGIEIPAVDQQPAKYHPEVVINPSQEENTIWFHEADANFGNAEGRMRYYKWPRNVPALIEEAPPTYQRLLHGNNYWVSADESEVLSWQCTNTITFSAHGGPLQSSYFGFPAAARVVPSISLQGSGVPAIFYRGHAMPIDAGILAEVVVPEVSNGLRFNYVTSAAFVAHQDGSSSKQIVFTLASVSGQSSVVGGGDYLGCEALFVGRVVFRDGVPRIEHQVEIARFSYVNPTSDQVDHLTDFGGSAGGNYGMGVSAVNRGQLYWSPDGRRAVGTRCVDGFLRKVTVTVIAGESGEVGVISIGGHVGSVTRSAITSFSRASDYALLSEEWDSTTTFTLHLPIYWSGQESTISLTSQKQRSRTFENGPVPYPLPTEAEGFTTGDHFGTTTQQTNSYSSVLESLVVGEITVVENHIVRDSVGESRVIDVVLNYEIGFPSAGLQEIIPRPPEGATFENEFFLDGLSGGVYPRSIVTVCDPTQRTIVVDECFGNRSEVVTVGPEPPSGCGADFVGASIQVSHNFNFRTDAWLGGHSASREIPLSHSYLIESTCYRYKIGDGGGIHDYPDEAVGGGAAPPSPVPPPVIESFQGGIRADWFHSWLARRNFSLNTELGPGGSPEWLQGADYPETIGFLPFFPQSGFSNAVLQPHAHHKGHAALHYKCCLYGLQPSDPFLIHAIEQLSDEVLVVDTLGLLEGAINFPGVSKGILDLGVL